MFDQREPGWSAASRSVAGGLLVEVAAQDFGGTVDAADVADEFGQAVGDHGGDGFAVAFDLGGRVSDQRVVDDGPELVAGRLDAQFWPLGHGVTLQLSSFCQVCKVS